jgi:hypothetical protein
MCTLRLLKTRWVLVLAGGWLLLPGCGETGVGGIDMFGQKHGEPWTIECLELKGIGAEENVQEIAAALRKTNGLNPERVAVQTKPNQAWIFYGTYFRDIDLHGGKRPIPRQMAKDLKKIKALGDTAGRRYFLAARVVPMPTPDVGPAEWDLRNVRGKYTLQVATYFNTGDVQDRKEAAVAKVRQLRSKGHDAYYYHGLRQSIVTVGEEALLDKSGQVRYVNYGGERHQVAHRYNDQVVALQKQEECKYNLTNDDIWYNLDKQTGLRAPVWSTLVRIPESDSDW